MGSGGRLTDTGATVPSWRVIRRTVIDSGSLTDVEAAGHALRAMSVRVESGLPAEAGPHTEAEDPLVPLDEAERRHIETVLRATAGNQTQAALILGIERKTLARKMKRFGIT